jgi:rfaE bifunctional protein kinase chain/domain
MTPARFHTLTGTYRDLTIAVLGDFCLDRYLEIDPARKEISIETQLPVHNVVKVRAQPGGAGTILNNLAALGVGTIFPISFYGNDGEGLELFAALGQRPGVRLDYLVRTDQRRTFTYCKPLIVTPDHPPVELNRLDFKNWTPTSPALQEELRERLEDAARSVDAIIVLEQVDIPETGVVTKTVLEGLKAIIENNPELLVVSDSRRGLQGYPPVTLKMNAAELKTLTGNADVEGLDAIRKTAAELARQRSRTVFVTLAEKGIVGASPGGQLEHVSALPVRGPIDIVGAGDAVTANLTSALTAGATLREAMELASAAGSVVIHKLGTTGTASVAELSELILSRSTPALQDTTTASKRS